jgi:hypothetical protein
MQSTFDSLRGWRVEGDGTYQQGRSARPCVGVPQFDNVGRITTPSTFNWLGNGEPGCVKPIELVAREQFLRPQSYHLHTIADDTWRRDTRWREIQPLERRHVPTTSSGYVVMNEHPHHRMTIPHWDNNLRDHLRR